MKQNKIDFSFHYCCSINNVMDQITYSITVGKIMNHIKNQIWSLITRPDSDWRGYGVNDENIYNKNTRTFDEYIKIVSVDILEKRTEWYLMDEDEKEEFPFDLDDFIPLLETLHPDSKDGYQNNFEEFCEENIDILFI